MARARNKPEPEGGPGFLTTYADIVTLLMAFFVLLFAISSIDQVKFLALLKGLEEDFGNSSYSDLIIDGGAGLVGANQPAGSAIPVPGGTLTAQPLEAVSELAVLAAHAEAAEEQIIAVDDDGTTATDGDEVAPGQYLDDSDLEQIAFRLLATADEASLAGALEVGFNQRGLVISLSTDGVLFASGSAALDPTIAETVLAPIAAELADFDNDLYVEGHTDDVPLGRGSYDNWDLSVDRALAVLDYFELEAGIAPQRLAASGFGEHRPIDPASTPEARQRNRRVELVVAYADAGVTPIDPLPASDSTPSQAPIPFGTGGIL